MGRAVISWTVPKRSIWRTFVPRMLLISAAVSALLSLSVPGLAVAFGDIPYSFGTVALYSLPFFALMCAGSAGAVLGNYWLFYPRGRVVLDREGVHTGATQ